MILDLHGITIQTYLLERQIGDGTMTQVYFARDYRTQQSVAVKVARANAPYIDLTRQLFAQETAVHQTLTHPHILPVLGQGELARSGLDFSLPYLITPYMAGESVALYRQRLAQQRQAIPAASAVKLAALVADALAAAHAQGVLHLDLKPENLLLHTPGNLATVMVADFGGQAIRSEAPVVQNIVGTPAYMAPEQIAGQPLDDQADIYALGVLLYELVVGKRPFPGQTLATIFPQQRQHLPLHGVPPSLQPILAKMLAFTPADRYTSARELAAALRQWLLDFSPQGANGRIPHPGPIQQTRLIATAWLPPLNQTRGIDYSQRWQEGAYRFYIAHPDGQINIHTLSEAVHILEIGRLPQTANSHGNSHNHTPPPGIYHIQLNDPYVSEKHATVERFGSGWQIMDNGSTNGTFLDGEPLEAKKPSYWRGRTLLRIGPYILAWEAYDKYGLSPEQAEEAYLKEESDFRRLMDGAQFWQTSRDDDFLDVLIEPNAPLPLAPGETAELTVTLTSRSPIVERVEIIIEDLPPSWFTIPQIDFAPVAGLSQTVSIQIHPPKNQATAGSHKGKLVVFSPRTGEPHFEKEIVINISAKQGKVLDLHPKNVPDGGHTELTIWNTGNEPASFLVLARDPANGLRLEPANSTVLVPPGQQVRHLVKVEVLQKRPLLPPTKQLPYELRVGRSQTELETVTGQVSLKPLLPWWLPLILLLLIALAVFAVPRVAGRMQAGQEMVAAGEENKANAEATIISAEATIVLAEELLANEDPNATGTPSPEIQQVKDDLAQAKADLASAQAAAAAADQAIADGEDIGPIGPAIPPAQPPTAVLLDNNSIAEDAPSGTVIGLLSSEDPNENETHTYSLVPGEGDGDNGLFNIEGSQLKLLGSLDFETQPTLSLRVQSQDMRGELFAQRLTVNVTDANEPFTAIALDNATVPENRLSAIVGELTAVDNPDKNDTLTFTLADDPTGLLEISGPSLRVQTGQALNYEDWLEQEGEIPLEISGSDGNNSITQTITIQLENKNDPPVVSGFGRGMVEDEPLEIRLDAFNRACQDEDEPDGTCQLSKIRISLLPSNGFLLLVPRNFVYDRTEPLEPDQTVYEGREIALAPFQKLLYVPDRNFNGRVQFRWNGFDGEDYGVLDTAVTITITPANDPPSFKPDTNLITVKEDANQQSFNWAVDIRYPDGDPSDLRFAICNANEFDRTLFKSGPTINEGGNLVFAPAENKNGTADLQILLTEQPRPANGDETAVCAGQTTVPLKIVIEPQNDAPQITGTISRTITMSATVGVLTNGVVSDIDSQQVDNFSFKSGSLELVISNPITETLIFSPTLSSSQNMTVTESTIYHEGKQIGILVGEGTSQMRVEDLTENATIPVLNEVLRHFYVNVRDDNSIFVIISLNDGGNIGVEDIPKFGSITVDFTIN